jgi:predicted metal-dependent HD superfamily phosphohydrolase
MPVNFFYDEIGTYIHRLFEEYHTPALLYHNLQHTLNVVRHGTLIAEHYALSARDRFILVAACYFHDTGHLFGDMEGHEETGAGIMRDFFRDKILPNEEVEAIAACILATETHAKPVDILQEIIRDADTFHLGLPDFFDEDKRVWDEFQLRTGKSVVNRIERSLRFLENHRYCTERCRQLLDPGKLKNMEILRSRLAAF